MGEWRPTLCSLPGFPFCESQLQLVILYDRMSARTGANRSGGIFPRDNRSLLAMSGADAAFDLQPLFYEIAAVFAFELKNGGTRRFSDHLRRYRRMPYYRNSLPESCGFGLEEVNCRGEFLAPLTNVVEFCDSVQAFVKSSGVAPVPGVPSVFTKLLYNFRRGFEMNDVFPGEVGTWGAT